MSEFQSPANPSKAPGLAENLDLLVFTSFDTLNLKPTRQAIQPNEMYWCDNFMPVGKSNLKSLPGKGSNIYTVSGKTIRWFGFFNIFVTQYYFVCFSDGSGVINLVSTNSTIYSFGSATFPVDSIFSPSGSQWGSQYYLIVASTGYFVFDGTLVYTSGTLAPGVTITDGGSGYTSAPTVSASGGSGSGATFTATVSGGSVVTIAITNAGSGYVAGDTVTLAFSGGGGTGAVATVTLMPFGNVGTSSETYKNRVWHGSGANLYFSAAESVSDFASSTGGGFITSTDSFLKVSYIKLVQSNGFLYTIADSSINYISNVQTSSATPPVTTFQNVNVDPQIGTIYMDSVQTFSRDIIFVNPYGIHALSGGTIRKISTPLDTLFQHIPSGTFPNGLNPSSCQAVVYGQHIYACLFPIYDLITGSARNALLMTDGTRWWTGSQENNLIFVTNSEVNATLVPYGTDGTSIFPILQNYSATLSKTLQSKYWDTPSYLMTKAPQRVAMLASSASSSALNLTISIDSPQGSQSFSTAGFTDSRWTQSGQKWFSTNISQSGYLTGITLTTSEADCTIQSITVAQMQYNLEM